MFRETKLQWPRRLTANTGTTKDINITYYKLFSAENNSIKFINAWTEYNGNGKVIKSKQTHQNFRTESPTVVNLTHKPNCRKRNSSQQRAQKAAPTSAKRLHSAAASCSKRRVRLRHRPPLTNCWAGGQGAFNKESSAAAQVRLQNKSIRNHPLNWRLSK